MSLMWHTEIVGDTRDSHKFLCGSRDEILSVVRVDELRDAEDGEGMEKRDHRFDRCFVFNSMQHYKPRALFFHKKDFGRLSELAGARNGHVIAVPSTKKRSASKNCFIHCVWQLLLEAKTLTLWAGGNVTSDVDEPCGPVMPSRLQLSDGLIAAVVARGATMTGANEVDVLRRNR